MGRECCFELVTTLLPKVTVQRLNLLKLTVLDLLKTQCWRGQNWQGVGRGGARNFFYPGL